MTTWRIHWHVCLKSTLLTTQFFVSILLSSWRRDGSRLPKIDPTSAIVIVNAVACSPVTTTKEYCKKCLVAKNFWWLLPGYKNTAIKDSLVVFTFGWLANHGKKSPLTFSPFLLVWKQSSQLTIPESNSKCPWKPPKGRDRLPIIHFQVLWLLVSGSVNFADSLNPQILDSQTGPRQLK